MTQSTPSPVSALMRRIIMWGALAAFVIALAVGAVSYFIVGMPGVWSAIIGASAAFAFFAITAVLMLFTANSAPTTMAAAVLGGFLIKIAGLLGLVALLSGKDFYHPLVLFIALTLGAVASLAVDVIAVKSAQIPHVDPTAKKQP